MHPPQWKSLVCRSTQVPPQSVSPASHPSAGAFVVLAAHSPCWQVSPAPQAMPQAPQLSGSLLVSTQASPQTAKGGAQFWMPPPPQTPSEQLLTGHTLPQ